MRHVAAALIIFFTTSSFGQSAEKLRAFSLAFDPVSGASSYQFEIASSVPESRFKPITVTTKQPSWSGELAPGQYKLRMRSIDMGEIAGEWSAWELFSVSSGPKLTMEASKGSELKGEDESQVPVRFGWQSRPAGQPAGQSADQPGSAPVAHADSAHEDKKHTFFLRVRKDAPPQNLYTHNEKIEKFLPKMGPGAWIQIELGPFEIKQKLIDEANGVVGIRTVHGDFQGEPVEMFINDDYHYLQTWNPRLTPVYFQTLNAGKKDPILVFNEPTLKSQAECQKSASACVIAQPRESEFWLQDIKVMLAPEGTKIFYHVSFLDVTAKNKNKRLYGWIDSADVQVDMSEPAAVKQELKAKSLSEEVGLEILTNYHFNLGLHSFDTSGPTAQSAAYSGLELGGQIGGYLSDKFLTFLGLNLEPSLYKFSGSKSAPTLVTASQEILYAQDRRAVRRWIYGVEGDIFAPLPSDSNDAFGAAIAARGVAHYQFPHWQTSYHGGPMLSPTSIAVTNYWITLKGKYHKSLSNDHFGWAETFALDYVHFNSPATSTTSNEISFSFGFEKQM